MKKLLLIALASVALLTGIGFADFTTLSVSPTDQVAMSGTLVSRSFQITNSTGDAYVVVKMPQTANYDVVYQNSSLLPINNALIQLGVDHDPIFTIASGATVTLSVTSKMVTTNWSFPATSIHILAANDAGFTTVFTSAMATISPIADVITTKTITGTLPIYSGDLVSYLVTLQNIGSHVATGIQLADTFPIPMFGVPSASINGNPLAYNVPITYPNTFVWDIGSLYPLQPGQSVTFLITSPLTHTTASGTVFVNKASATCGSLEYTTGNNTAIATGQIASADLNLFSGSVTGLQPLLSGDTVHFSLWYNNSGPAMTGEWMINVSGTNASGRIIPDYFLGYTTGNMGVSATMNSGYAPGTQICLHAVMSGVQETGPLSNNGITVCATVAPKADLFVTKTMQVFTGYQAGSVITYTITYGNSGGTGAQNVTIQDIPSTGVYVPTLTWNIGTLPAGSGGTITFTGSLLSSMQAGQTFVNTAMITGTSLETSVSNNMSSVTGIILSLSNISLDIKANNLSKPNLDNAPYGSGPDSRIQAVSGDIVQLMITYANNGNISGNNVNIALAGLGGFVQYGTFTGAIGTLGIGATGTIILTGVVGPQNYISFTPTATLTYTSGTTLTDAVIVQEPYSCGDGMITRDEACDIAGPLGTMFSGQVCEKVNGFCKVVTKYIINTACFNYTYTSIGGIGTGQICSSVQLPVVAEGGLCRDLISHDGSIVVVEEDHNGDYQGNADFTCYAQSGLAQTIAIDCGNGEIHTGINVSSYDATCHFDENSVPEDRYVRCYVDGQTQESCEEHMIIDEMRFGRCGDGIRQGYEDCDDGEDNGTSRSNCSIGCDLKGSAMAACFSVNNNNVSVQDNEILPFRWKVDVMGNDLSTSRDGNCSPGDINKRSMQCEFRLFNGALPESGKGSDLGDYDAPTVKTWTVPCNTDAWTDDGDFGEPNKLFQYFYNQRSNIRSLQDPFGRYMLDMSDVDLDGVYGEYNLALYKVSYEYCDGDGNRVEGTPIDRVCESDFAVTKPYIAQKSSFGLTPKSSTINLDGYKDIFGEDIISSTDLDKIMVLDAETYKGGTSVSSLMNTFITKYSKLGVSVDKKKVPALNQAGVTSIKIVPQQKIYIIEGTAGTTLTLNPDLVSSTPFTIVTKNINLVVEGNVSVNGMFLVKDGTITFKEPTTNKCAATQKVKGIFITNKGFVADPESLANDDVDTARCPYGGLHVQGILIGGNDGLKALVESRRSQLNHRFYAGSSHDPSVLAERRNEIFNGAAVLIEYSPSLRSSLPPGASEFTKALDVYKK